MTLQKQEKDRKRMSMAAPPAGLGLNAGEEVLEAEEKLSRRTSVLGRNHRRVSSQSEPDVPLATLLAPSTSPSTVSPVPGLRTLRLGQLPSPQPFDDPYRNSLSPPSEHPSTSRAEVERLRTELAATMSRLAESEESRLASEAVLKALREFVGGATGVVDLNDPETMEELRGISLPPLPTDPDEPSSVQEEKKSAGWGFNKLWKPTTTLAPPTPGSPLSNAAEAPATPHIMSPPRSIRSNSTPRVSPLPTSAELPLSETSIGAIPAQTPLASFVSSWTKTVPPGTPAVATRAFSSFFRKGAGKEKDLAPNPAPVSEAGSVGAERVDVVDLTNEVSGLGLEPSPMGKDAGEGGVEVFDRDLETENMADSQAAEGKGVGGEPMQQKLDDVKKVDGEQKLDDVKNVDEEEAKIENQDEGQVKV